MNIFAREVRLLALSFFMASSHSFVRSKNCGLERRALRLSLRLVLLQLEEGLLHEEPNMVVNHVVPKPVERQLCQHVHRQVGHI